MMEASRIELRRSHRMQREYITELKKVDEDLKFHQQMVDREKIKIDRDLNFKENTI